MIYTNFGEGLRFAHCRTICQIALTIWQIVLQFLAQTKTISQISMVLSGSSFGLYGANSQAQGFIEPVLQRIKLPGLFREICSG